MINLDRIEQEKLMTSPYDWAFVNELFTPEDAAALASSFPRDNFKTVTGYDGEKGYEYEARSLIHMGADTATHADELSPHWRQLAADLLSPDYRQAMTHLTGCDLTAIPIEVNVFHYGPGAWLGPHVDLKDKIVTHVLYFNEEWDKKDGGCLTVLHSSNMSDLAADVAPIVGNSAVLVRSEKSWHAVSRVTDGCHLSRRSMTVTFYHPDSISTLWPPGDTTPLHRYDDAAKAKLKNRAPGILSRLRRKLSSLTK
jgi:Rps23 Pro-64 3,4-dihydroxylase Tpa1-like proline 4-hydroxylase